MLLAVCRRASIAAKCSVRGRQFASIVRWTIVLAALFDASTARAGERKVLTIALDGLRPDALMAANAPNIDSLLDGSFFGTPGPSGIFADYAQSEHLTFSGPGWGAYMTGLHVDRHGADTNGFENVVPGTTDWFTPLEAFNPGLNTHRVITWVIAHTSIPSGADVADVYEYDQNGDELMTNRVVDLMQTSATDAVMMFYSDTDTAGHTFGFDPAAPGYLAEIESTDAQIGQVLSAMAARPTFSNEDWLVLLTSDHGGLGTGHHGGLPPQRTIPFIVAGPLATTILPQAHPRQVDVAATVLAYFGAPIPSNYDGRAVGLTPAGPALAAFGQNLVFNGDAEFNRGFDSNGEQQYAAGWGNPGPGGVTMIRYGAPDGFPSAASPGPSNRGANFFSGGLNATSTMTQTIDVSNLAALVDGGNVEFVLSAFLGGYLNQNDVAAVTARFIDEFGSEAGTAVVGPVTAADRGNSTGLLYRETFDAIPALTRTIFVELTATRASGENDGYADNLSLALLLPGDLDYDAQVDAADWMLFRSGQHANMAGLSRQATFELGDLNADFRNNHADFVTFKTLFEAANGAGSFAALLSVPEPPSVAMFAMASVALVAMQQRRQDAHRAII